MVRAAGLPVSSRIVIARHTWPSPAALVMRENRAWKREQRVLLQAAYEKHVAETHAKELEHIRTCKDCQADAKKRIEMGQHVPDEVLAILKGAPN